MTAALREPSASPPRVGRQDHRRELGLLLGTEPPPTTVAAVQRLVAATADTDDSPLRPPGRSLATRVSGPGRGDLRGPRRQRARRRPRAVGGPGHVPRTPLDRACGPRPADTPPPPRSPRWRAPASAVSRTRPSAPRASHRRAHRHLTPTAIGTVGRPSRSLHSRPQRLGTGATTAGTPCSTKWACYQ